MFFSTSFPGRKRWWPLISALFGFTNIAGTSMWAAQILFFVFLVLFVVSLVAGNRTTRTDL